MKPRLVSLIGTGVLVLLGVYLLLVAAGGDELTGNGLGADSTIVAERQADALDESPSETFDGQATITEAELPLEALDTLDLIDDGGPYPFDRDDLTFQNREGLLPDRSPDHYREYTVITPGEDDRGARRIVTGADGERYYTADHYNSFRAIVSADS